MIRKLLAVSLVSAPILLCAAEFARLTVQANRGGTAGTLSAIAHQRGTWEIFGWLTLALVVTWLGAVLGLVEAARDLRPRAAWIGGVVAVTGAVAFAMHQGQYVELNAVLARDPQYIQTAVRVGINGTRMEDTTVLLQLVGVWLGPVILGSALARAGVMAWWQFACIPVWVVLFVFTGSNAPAFSAVHLLLLPPYLTVARSLLRTPTPANGAAPVARVSQERSRRS